MLLIHHLLQHTITEKAINSNVHHLLKIIMNRILRQYAEKEKLFSVFSLKNKQILI